MRTLDVHWVHKWKRKVREPEYATHKARCGFQDDHGDYSCPGAFGFLVPAALPKADPDHPAQTHFDSWHSGHLRDLDTVGRVGQQHLSGLWFVQYQKFRLAPSGEGRPMRWTTRGHAQRRAMLAPALLEGERVWAQPSQMEGMVEAFFATQRRDTTVGPPTEYQSDHGVLLLRDKRGRIASDFRVLSVGLLMAPLFLECPICDRLQVMDGRKLPATGA